ncbi:MAG: methylated-DNA--[protein]-cysteine S-methyltransferase [Actinomycetota bacterium]|nr:methylated-DNA--[protein]-cysteine S-methyltransferase [Actinomycetota bacterium]
MTQTETITTQLAGLARPAPESTIGAVLRRTDLADEYALIEGPTGPAYVAWNGRGITAFVPTEAVGSPDDFEARHPRDASFVEAPPDRLAHRLEQAIETGRLGRLSVDLSSIGEFQRKVLEKCAEIPPGEIRPYGWIAREIGNPSAVRAVGTALGRNPVPVLIPCHRVVRTDGRIGSYAYGSSMKRSLLEHEGLDPEAIETQARRGVRLVGSDTTRIYCYPTCRHAKRINDTHRIEFASEATAIDEGYRACKVCRPAA